MSGGHGCKSCILMQDLVTDYVRVKTQLGDCICCEMKIDRVNFRLLLHTGGCLRIGSYWNLQDARV